jgi:hypothetical protein
MTLAVMVACGGSPRAQSVSDVDMKVALLYNFAKFVDWPPDALPAGAPVTFCIIGDQELRSALGAAAKGRSINGHDVAIVDVANDGAIDRCTVVYAPRTNAAGIQSLLKAAAGAPVLTVSDQERFAERGGVANFYRDGDRLRFAVNVEVARRQRLGINSRLLALAAIVKSTH